MKGTAEAGDTVVVKNGSNTVGSVTVGTNNTWSLSVSGLQNGQTYNYVATASDAAGNTAASAPFAFTVDTTGPTDTLNGETVVLNQSGQASVTVSGRASDNIGVGSVLVGNNQVGLDSSGKWSLTDSALKSGSHGYNVTTTDYAGNTSTASGSTVTVNGAANGKNVSLNGTIGGDTVNAYSGGATVSITDSSSNGGNNTVTAIGGNNKVTVNDKGGHDTITLGGNGNTVTLAGTGGSDQITFQSGHSVRHRSSVLLSRVKKTRSTASLPETIRLPLLKRSVCLSTPISRTDFQSTASAGLTTAPLSWRRFS